MLRPYQKAMKERVTTVGAFLAPTTLATVLRARRGGSSEGGEQGAPQANDFHRVQRL